MALPGLSFEIVQSAGPLLGIRADRTAIVALTERGPVEQPTLVHSYEEYVAEFGDFVEGMLGPLAAKAYYDNSGEELVVTRFVPREAKAAHATLDVVGASAESPSFRVEFEARDPGEFGNRISVEALTSLRTRARGTAVDTNADLVADAIEFTDLLGPLFDETEEEFPIRLIHATGEEWSTIVQVNPAVGTSQRITIASPLPLPGTAVIVELYEPTFTLRIREPQRADVFVAGIDLRDVPGAQTLLASSSVTIVSHSTLGAELPPSNVVARFSGGVDGLDPGNDQGALADSFLRALVALEASDLPDIVIAPDLWSGIFRTKGVDRLALSNDDAKRLSDEMVRSAARTRDRVVIVDPPLGGVDGLRPLATSELETWKEERAAALLEDRDFAATYTPWVRIVADPVFKGGDTMLFPPSAHVAGQMSLTARRRGPWIATGNIALEQVVGLSETLMAADEERLQDVGINPLRMTLPRGATIQGVRSLSFPDRAPWRFISTRRLFDFLRRALRPIGLSYVFEPNAPATWTSLRRDVERLLQDLYSNGALAGSRPEDAFFVKVDDSLNPEAARNNGVLTAEIAVAPAAPLEFLVVRLVVSGGVSNVVEAPNVP